MPEIACDFAAIADAWAALKGKKPRVRESAGRVADERAVAVGGTGHASAQAVVCVGRTEEPPRRISAQPGHRWYDPWWAPRVTVLLNGSEVANAIAADAGAGWVRVRSWAGGRQVYVREEFLEGEVRIVAKERAR